MYVNREVRVYWLHTRHVLVDHENGSLTSYMQIIMLKLTRIATSVVKKMYLDLWV